MKRPIDSWVVPSAELSLIGKRFIFMTSAAEVETDFRKAKYSNNLRVLGQFLATPLLREDIPIGVIMIRRTEVRPFTDKQVSFLKLLPLKP